MHYSASQGDGCDADQGDAMANTWICATIDATTSPPVLRIPERFNAAHDLWSATCARAARPRSCTSTMRARTPMESWRRGSIASPAALHGFGMHMEQRILLCLQDGIDFPTAFLGAIKAGIVPVPVNTLLSPADYAYMLQDSRAPMLVISTSRCPDFPVQSASISLSKHVLVAGRGTAAGHALARRSSRGLDGLSFEPALTVRDEPCFWLYSSGSTGAPKGTVHVHSSLIETAALYAQATLGLKESDVMLLGRETVLRLRPRQLPDLSLGRGRHGGADGRAHRPRRPSLARLRCIVPRFSREYRRCMPRCSRAMSCPAAQELSLAVVQFGGRSAARGRRAALARRHRRRHRGWHRLDRNAAHLHFQPAGSNPLRHFRACRCPDSRPRSSTKTGIPSRRARSAICWCAVRPAQNSTGTSTRAVARLSSDLGPAPAIVSVSTINGDYVYAGRADDMLKVGGIYVSPIEVESALIAHPAVHEAAVVGKEDCRSSGQAHRLTWCSPAGSLPRKR